MTLGIAVPFPGGSILCTDARAEAGEGPGDGVLCVSSGRRMVAITSATQDESAGKMLASAIAAVACGSTGRQDLVPGIKRVMGDWFRAYGAAPAPPVQFLVASNSPEENSGRILLCEPPNTVVESYGPCVIGSGARPLDSWLGLVAPSPHEEFSLRSTVLRITYLIHIARRYESQPVARDTEMIVLSRRGSISYVDRKELKIAESIGEKVDALLLDICRQVLCAEGDASPQSIAEEFLRGYFDVMEQNPQVLFPSLAYLERQIVPEAARPEIAHRAAAASMRRDPMFAGASEVGVLSWEHQRAAT